MILLLALACLPVEGDRLLARDFGAAWPGMAALGEAPAGFAPVPGARRIFSRGELARLAARHGLQAPAAEICFEHPLSRLTAEDVTAAIQPQFPGARIAIQEISRFPIPRGELVFPRQGLRPDGTWRGWVLYGSRRFPVWARVRISLRARRVRAVERLAAGRPIGASQVREEETDVSPGTGRFAEEAAQVVGSRPRGPVASGALVRLDLLSAPLDIERGDAVTVRVENGAARLTVQARAESGGRRGDTIRLRNPESRRAFTARVESKARAVVASK